MQVGYSFKSFLNNSKLQFEKNIYEQMCRETRCFKNNQQLYNKLENYQALLWWIFQTGKFLREKATLI